MSILDLNPLPMKLFLLLFLLQRDYGFFELSVSSYLVLDWSTYVEYAVKDDSYILKSFMVLLPMSSLRSMLLLSFENLLLSDVFGETILFFLTNSNWFSFSLKDDYFTIVYGEIFLDCSVIWFFNKEFGDIASNRFRGEESFF